MKAEHARIQRGDRRSGQNHNFDRFLQKLAFGRPPPPPPLEKVGPLPHPVKCCTPSGTLENYCFPKKKNHRTLGSVPSVKLLNKLKMRTKNSKNNKKRCPSFLLSCGPGPTTPPPPPPPPPPPHLVKIPGSAHADAEDT